MYQKLRRFFKEKISGRAPLSTTNGLVVDVHLEFENIVQRLNYYFLKNPMQKKQFEEELAYLNSSFTAAPGVEKKNYAILPYPFVFNYDYTKVPVHKDEAAGMFYVKMDGKNLYYHKGFTNIADVQKSFTFICAEQDPKSPHLYMPKDFFVSEDDAVADFGAAEGNFSLMVVDKVRELFIFEADPIWIEALQMTFSPWKHKVHIINKFVGDDQSDNTIRVRDFFKNKKLDFLKMDIEGMEVRVLTDSVSFLKERKLKMIVTTYHGHSDAAIINHLLQINGYNTSFSDNYMLFIYDELRPPFFRKAIIRASNLK